MLETAVILDRFGAPLYWHEPLKRSMSYMNDSAKLWDIIWEARDNISGIAHTHPGSGFPYPSETDRTTFLAVEAGLWEKLSWPILSCNRMVVCRTLETKKLHVAPVLFEPTWATELRLRSNYYGISREGINKGM